MKDLSTLVVTSAIIHDLVADEEGNHVFSGAPSAMDEGELMFVRQRAIRSLQTGAFDAVFDDPMGAVSTVLEPLLDAQPKPVDLVTSSTGLAQDLVAAQDHISASTGMLVICTATFGSDPAALIMKLERETGARTEETTTGGVRRISIAIENGLIWTAKTRVFKTALIVKDHTNLRVTDMQTKSEKRIADYWMQFLGVSFAVTPAEQTKTLYDIASSWVNQIADPAKRYRYSLALAAELQSHSPTFKQAAFATNYLDTEDRKSFTRTTSAAGLDSGSVPKDISLIEKQLQGIRITMEEGITITAVGEAREQVTVTELEAGLANVEVEGTIKTMKGVGSG